MEEEDSTELELDSSIVNNQVYKNYISKRVKEDIEKGVISENDISYSMMDIPDELYNFNVKGEFIIDCQGTGMRLVLSKTKNNIIVWLALNSEDFPIY